MMDKDEDDNGLLMRCGIKVYLQLFSRSLQQSKTTVIQCLLDLTLDIIKQKYIHFVEMKQKLSRL